jgi:hypothetical protein
MPAGSVYGRLVINVAHFVPELWRSMDSTVERNTNWEGWVLTFIATKVIPHKAMKTNKNNPFHVNKLSARKVSEMLMSKCLIASEEPLILFNHFPGKL